MANPTLKTLQVRLYTTLGCHLCEDAYALLKQQGVGIEKVEIADDDELFERYCLRIPVVGHRAGCQEGDELDWPFDASQLAHWLNQQL